MLTINKQDVFKTILIIWFVATTGYVIYDIYAGYKIRGMQAAYNQGYTDSVNQLIDQTQKSQCQPFEVHSGDTKVQILDAKCVQQPSQQVQQGAPQPATAPAKK